jgi:hypothetical protein
MIDAPSRKGFTRWTEEEETFSPVDDIIYTEKKVSNFTSQPGCQ